MSEQTPETDALMHNALDSNDLRAWQLLARRLERERDAARAERDEAREDVALCRDAIEHALDLVAEWEKEHDDDSASASARVTRRRLNEALGKAEPRLLYEKPEGQQLFALAWKELRRERDALREALRETKDLAEFWINRQERRGMSDYEYRTWHQLGHGSNAMQRARALLEKTS